MEPNDRTQLEKELIEKRRLEKVSDNIFRMFLEPHYYIDEDGNHMILGSIMVCVYDNHATFGYTGTFKRKGVHKHNAMHERNILYDSITSVFPNEILDAYDKWHKECMKYLKTIKQIL